MAVIFCPSRALKSLSQHHFFAALDDDSFSGPVPSMGRITGSASIETLVRVGIEKENGLGPESKMVVLHDFTPCVEDELEVKRGQIVHVLYQENDWVYVISENNQEGFIPHSFCAPYGSQLAGLALNVKKKLPRSNDQNTVVPPPPASGGSTGAGGNRFGTGNPPPDVLNPSIGMKSHDNSSDPNMTIATSTASGMGRVNAGMEHSDSDSFPDNRMMPAAFTMQQTSNMMMSRSNNDHQSRSNSLMSETSSQPDIHPFFKVQIDHDFHQIHCLILDFSRILPAVS